MAARINWLWLRRSVMPQCRGGMLMLFMLLISALWRWTDTFLTLSFPIITGFIPNNPYLRFTFCNFKDDYAYFTLHLI